MTSLHRKLLRDLWHLKGQVGAIAMVVASGVAVVVTSRTAYESLAGSQAHYYAAYRFADIFTQLERAPESLVRRIEAIPGVVAVHTRIVFDVTLDVPGLAEPAMGRLTSIPERAVPMLNDLYIRRGRYIGPGRRDEVLISEAFAAANNLEMGSTFGAILNGRWVQLRVAGIALSPEYIYEIRGTDIFPDNKRFGVLWMSRKAMESAFDMKAAFNDLVLKIEPGASEAEVMARLDDLLERYGGLGAFSRADQISHRFVSDEIRQNRVLGTVLPAIFLGVAAFLLNVVLSRLVSTQRDQVGVLKAFGYSHRTVSLHYLSFALVAVAVGALAGTATGLWLGSLINRLYAEFYRFPIFSYDPNPGVIALAIGVSGLAALIGAAGAVQRAWAIPAAEAMRPEPPASFHAGWLERLGAQRFLPPAVRMIMRNLARRPVRAGLSVLGIAFAVAILVLGRYFIDAIEHLATVQFRYVQRDHVTVVAHEPLPGRARFEMSQLPGVMRAEPFRVVPVRLRFEHRSRRTGLMGLSSSGGLRRLLDRNLEEVALPPHGVVLTSKLAELLRVVPGDVLTVEVLEGSRPIRRVAVAGLVDEFIGLSAYMHIEALNQLMREGPTISGALLAVDAVEMPRLNRVVKRLPAVAGAMQREAVLQSFEDTLGQSVTIFTTVLIGFACVIALAIVYNAARVALAERGRELASLRVLGFTRAEVALMLLGEQAVLVALAIPLGLLLGYGVCALMAWTYQWELFRMPLVVSRKTYAFALFVVLLASLGTSWLVRRRLDRIDLVAVLKARE